MLNKIKAVMLGHAVGDALGVPVEFCRRDVLAQHPVTDMIGFGTYKLPAGTWSDDTSMSLCELESLSNGMIDYDNIMYNFCKWYYDEEFTAHGVVFDVGNTCSDAIHNYVDLGLAANCCGAVNERANGNGSLMRMHPFVLYAFYNGIYENDFVSMITMASSLTHAHSISIDGCIIYAHVLKSLLQVPSKESIYKGLDVATHDVCCPLDTYYHRLLQFDIACVDQDNIKSTGYVVDSLEAALWCVLTTNNYKECVLKAVNLGGDTDTIAAIAGSLAGALYGLDSIPTVWLNILKRKDYIIDMCQRAYDKWSRSNYKVCDIHAHIVPGVDDGASDLNMSIDILREAYAQGTRSIVCTSHDGFNMKHYITNLEALKHRATEENIKIELYAGCEVYCSSDIIAEVIFELNSGKIATINNTNYVLIEFDPYISIGELFECVKLLHDCGYQTILAHTERYVNLNTNSIWIKLLHQMGCLFQVNAYSLQDAKSEHIKYFARQLLQDKYVTFIGSDVHRIDYRRYAIQNGIEYVYQNCDAEYAQDICYRNAENILNIK